MTILGDKSTRANLINWLLENRKNIANGMKAIETGKITQLDFITIIAGKLTNGVVSRYTKEKVISDPFIVDIEGIEYDFDEGAGYIRFDDFI